MSGHSKWSQIKHKKGVADAKRGQLFSKLVKEITIAARAGGMDPAANPRLRAAVERARAEGLPKDNMERAISRASGTGPDAELSELLCEATAPGGTAVIIEAITDNRNRTVNEIKHLLAGHGARLVEPGSLLWNFEKIGVLEITASANAAKTKEETETAIMDSGARDFREENGAWIVETEFADLEKARAALERAGIVMKETGHNYKPRAPITPAPEARTSLDLLLDALAEHDDVQEVYANLRE